jgi:hypothetical protein
MFQTKPVCSALRHGFGDPFCAAANVDGRLLAIATSEFDTTGEFVRAQSPFRVDEG